MQHFVCTVEEVRDVASARKGKGGIRETFVPLVTAHIDVPNRLGVASRYSFDTPIDAVHRVSGPETADATPAAPSISSASTPGPVFRFSSARTTFAVDGYPTKCRPIRLVISCRDQGSVLSPVRLFAESKMALELYLPPLEEKAAKLRESSPDGNVVGDSAVWNSNCWREGVEWVALGPQHHGLWNQRGMYAKIRLKWLLVGDLLAAFTELAALLERDSERELRALAHLERRSRPLNHRQARPAATSAPPRGGATPRQLLNGNPNAFTHEHCLRTKLPLRQLLEGPSAAGATARSPSPGFLALPSSDECAAAEDDHWRAAAAERHRPEWVTRELSAYAAPASWLPTETALDALRVKDDERALRPEERIRMQLAREALRVRDEDDVGDNPDDEPASTPRPPPQRAVHTARRSFTVAIYEQRLRPASGIVFPSCKPPATNRRHHFHSTTHTDDVFSHLHAQGTHVISAFATAEPKPAPPKKRQRPPKSAARPPNPRLYHPESHTVESLEKEIHAFKAQLQQLQHSRPGLEQKEKRRTAQVLDHLFLRV